MCPKRVPFKWQNAHCPPLSSNIFLWKARLVPTYSGRCVPHCLSRAVLGLNVTKIVCFGFTIIRNRYLLSTSIIIILILSVLIFHLHSGTIKNCLNISDHFRAVSHFFNSSPRISEPRHGSISIKLMNSAGTRPRLGVSISTCLVSQGWMNYKTGTQIHSAHIFPLILPEPLTCHRRMWVAAVSPTKRLYTRDADMWLELVPSVVCIAFIK